MNNNENNSNTKEPEKILEKLEDVLSYFERENDIRIANEHKFYDQTETFFNQIINDLLEALKKIIDINEKVKIKLSFNKNTYNNRDGYTIRIHYKGRHNEIDRRYFDFLLSNHPMAKILSCQTNNFPQRCEYIIKSSIPKLIELKEDLTEKLSTCIASEEAQRQSVKNKLLGLSYNDLVSLIEDSIIEEDPVSLEKVKQKKLTN